MTNRAKQPILPFGALLLTAACTVPVAWGCSSIGQAGNLSTDAGHMEDRDDAGTPDASTKPLTFYEQILDETLRNDDSPEGKPLPFASVWNPGLNSLTDPPRSCRGYVDTDPLRQYFASAGSDCGAFGLNPAEQVQYLSKGKHILPVFKLDFEPWFSTGVETAPAYYQPLKFAAEHRLPVVLATTQLEAFFYLPNDTEHRYFSASEVAQLHANVPPGGLLFPYDTAQAKSLWHKAGTYWAQQKQMSLFSELYPAPQRVIVLTNNEYPRLAWQNVISACDSDPGICDFLDTHGVSRTKGDLDPWSANNVKLRQALGQAWNHHYQALFDGFLSGLTPAWKSSVRFVPYEDFLTIDYGFDVKDPMFVFPAGWTDAQKTANGYPIESWLAGGNRSITSTPGPGNVVSWARGWSGTSLSLYHYERTNNLVYNHLIRSQGLLFALEDVQRNIRSDYWFEVSVWNWEDYYDRLHAPTTDEVEGFIGQLQLELWLFRPRVARVFSMDAVPTERLKHFVDGAVDSVDRVWNHEILKRFWRNSQLVPLPDVPHPFSAQTVPGFETASRWYFLRTNVDHFLDGYGPCRFDPVSRKWHFELSASAIAHGCPDDIQVLAVARVSGLAPHREWLIYAFSPQVSANPAVATEIPNVQITIPGYEAVPVGTVKRRGSFFHLNEGQAPVDLSP